jgi:hypothetical protein
VGNASGRQVAFYYFGHVKNAPLPLVEIIDGDCIDLRGDAGAIGKQKKPVGPSTSSTSRPAKLHNKHTGQAHAGELAEVVAWIPNPQLDWVEWKNMALRIYAAGGDKSFAILQEWSQRCPDYDPVRGLIRSRNLHNVRFIRQRPAAAFICVHRPFSSSSPGISSASCS